MHIQKQLNPVELSQSSSELGTVNIEFSFKEVIQTDGNGRVKNEGYRPSASSTRPRMITPPVGLFGAL